MIFNMLDILLQLVYIPIVLPMAICTVLIELMEFANMHDSSVRSFELTRSSLVLVEAYEAARSCPDMKANLKDYLASLDEDTCPAVNLVQEAYNEAIVCIGPVPLDRVDCTQVWPAFDDLLVSSGIEEGPDPILLQCVRDLIKMSSRLAVRARSHALWEWDHDGIASGVLDGAAQVGEQGCPVPNFYDYLHTHQTTLPQVLQRIVAYAGADGVEQMQWSKESLGYRDMSHLPIVETMRSTGTTTEGGVQESWEYLDRAGMLDMSGLELARLVQHPAANKDTYEEDLVSAAATAEEFTRLQELMGQIQPPSTRPRAFDLCSNLVVAWHQRAQFEVDPNLVDVVEGWPKKYTSFTSRHLADAGRACVIVLLARNDRFADMDVVLQSQRLPDVTRTMLKRRVNKLMERMSAARDVGGGWKHPRTYLSTCPCVPRP